MSNYKFEIDTTKVFENMIVEKRYIDSTFKGYRIRAIDGYTIQDSYTQYNEEKEQEEVVYTYSNMIYTPAKYNWDNFSYVAVKESEINVLFE